MLVQILGALLILAGYCAAQLGLVHPHARSYLLVNVVGSAVLAYDAWHAREWGFLLLEGVWALVSLHGLARSTWPPAPAGQSAVQERACAQSCSGCGGTVR